ncbi:MAG: helix-turn-helix transcriptional regulator [Bacteroidia bacterium]|mgnify:CR=1 FL=1|nr:helix-turn-helix transcriptional regulator [Bacteroidia bacterium]
MGRITREQYEYARERIEELLPVVDGYDVKDKAAVELSVLSDIVIEYEKEYFPIEKPTVGELIADGLVEKSMTQKDLAERLGVSPSRVSDFVSGKSEPSLKQARILCQTLGIQPAVLLGI